MAERRDISDFMMTTLYGYIYVSQRILLGLFGLSFVWRNIQNGEYLTGIALAGALSLGLYLHWGLRRFIVRVQVDATRIYLSRGSREVSLPLTAITRVQYKSFGMTHFIVTLLLGEPTVFGQEVEFDCPTRSLKRPYMPPCVLDLRRLAGLPEHSPEDDA